MKKSRIALITLSALLGASALVTIAYKELPQTVVDRAERISERIPPMLQSRLGWSPNETITGNILAANFAQSQRDWDSVNEYMSRISEQIDSDDLTRLRLMLLALSAGEYEHALTYAQAVIEAPEAENLNTEQQTILMDGRNMAAMLLFANAVHASDFDEATRQLNMLSAPPLRALLEHVLSGWLQAASGKSLSDKMEDTAFLPVLHQALAAEWAGQTQVASKLMQELATTSLTPDASQMIAAFFVRNNAPEQAKTLLQTALERYPQEREIEAFLASLDKGDKAYKKDEWEYHLQGASAGIAEGLRDLAHYMSTEKSNDSALIFAHMARMIRADVPRLNLLIGNLYQEEERIDEAKRIFASIPPAAPDYLDAQIHLAELEAKLGNKSQAIATLENLLKKYKSSRAAYSLGEMHRMNQDFAAAVRAYDRAIELSGGAAEDGLWSVYFVRAMAHDELGNWAGVEADLKKALSYRPDNPLVLNYLGYSYADKGENLDEAKKMVIRALTQMPLDPYIIDSLGWVYFREGDYPQSLMFLERAVSLKPYDPVMNDHLGDLYAKTGRTLEAHYQWRRALGHADPVEHVKLINKINEKLENGLSD